MFDKIVMDYCKELYERCPVQYTSSNVARSRRAARILRARNLSGRAEYWTARHHRASLLFQPGETLPVNETFATFN